jgi:hypothetical protein
VKKEGADGETQEQEEQEVAALRRSNASLSASLRALQARVEAQVGLWVCLTQQSFRV